MKAALYFADDQVRQTFFNCILEMQVFQFSLRKSISNSGDKIAYYPKRLSRIHFPHPYRDIQCPDLFPGT